MELQLFKLTFASYSNAPIYKCFKILFVFFFLFKISMFPWLSAWSEETTCYFCELELDKKSPTHTHYISFVTNSAHAIAKSHSSFISASYL